MPRIRTVKPEFFQHEALYDAERASGLPLRVAFAGLWTVADKAGRFEWRPRQLKLNVLPYDDVDFGLVLEALEKYGFLLRYEAEGKAYGAVPSWDKHQHRNVREPESHIPAPDEAGARTCQVPAEAAGKGREGKGKGREDARVLAHAVAGVDPVALTRWSDYRRDTGKPIPDASLVAVAEELAKFGGNQAAVVQQSIVAGWTNLFELKKSNGKGNGKANGTGPPPKREPPTDAEIAEARRKAAADNLKQIERLGLAAVKSIAG